MDRMDRIFRGKPLLYQKAFLLDQLGFGCGRTHDHSDQRSTQHKHHSRFMSAGASRIITTSMSRTTQPTGRPESSYPLGSPPAIDVNASEEQSHSLRLRQNAQGLPATSSSPCPAICSWPAPPPNPRAELKPTAIAAPLAMPSLSARSSATVIPATTSSFLHLHHQPAAPSPSPLLQMPSASPQPSPIPRRLDEHNIPLLSVLRAVSANSAPAGGSSPAGYWGRETELRQKIQALEEVVAEYELQKLNVLGTFTDFRERVAERERRLEAEYSHKIIDLSEEVLGAKRDFEERMKSFQILQEQFEREKEQALEKLRKDHQREIQALEQRFSQSQLLNLEQKYMIEIQRLEEERNALRAERSRLGEEFEMKLRRVESLFETELTAAKLLYRRELQALREHEEALKEELAARQEEFHDRLMELQHQSRQAKDELLHCRDEVAQLQRALNEKGVQIQCLTKELAIARRQTEEAMRQLSQAHTEADDARRALTERKEELERNGERLREAEEVRDRLDETVRELSRELQTLRGQVELLEVERDGLRAQGQSQTQLHDSQVTALEAMLKSVTDEKEHCAERCKQLVERERAEAEDRELNLRREFSSKLGELEEQYNGLREHVEQDSFGPENVKLWEEIECLRAEKGQLESELAAKTNSATDLAKLASAIQSVEQKVSSVFKKEEKREEEDEKKEEGEEEHIDIARLLDNLRELELSVAGIVREKEQMEARLELLGEGAGGEMGWTRRAAEMERELEERRADMQTMEESHHRQREQLEAQVEELRRKLMQGTVEEEEEKEEEEERSSHVELVEQLERRLRETEKELESARAATEEGISKLEQQHLLALEGKISALNREHERTVELMQQREQEMAAELEQLKGNSARGQLGEVANSERAEGSSQTEQEHECEREKDDLIRRLTQELEELRRANKPKEGRSQSIASAGEHLALCQKAIIGGREERAKECQSRGNGQSWRGTAEEQRGQSPAGVGIGARMDATMPEELAPSPSPQRSLLLSPPTGGTQQSQQRVSPSRQVMSPGKNGGGEKRPAWKF